MDVLEGVQEMNEIRVRQVLVTPEMAGEWISIRLYKGQRALKNSWFHELVRKIKNGEWVMNGDTIKFDIDGNLIDGQHRCFAIHESGISVPALVATGLSTEAYIEIDNNKLSRTSADYLRSQGESDPLLLSPALNLLKKILKREISTQKTHCASTRELMSILSDHPNIRLSTHIAKDRRIRKIFRNSVSIVCHYMFNTQDSEMCCKFFNILADGQCDNPYSPALMLRNALLNARMKRNSIVKVEWELSIAAKAWHAFVAGKDVKILYMGKEEGFPYVGGF